MTPLRLKDFPETTVYIQPAPLPAAPHGAGARSLAPTSLTDKVGQTLDDAFVHIRNAAETVQHALQSLVTTAQEVSVELGFDIGAGAGVVLARADAGAHVRLILTWVRTP